MEQKVKDSFEKQSASESIETPQQAMKLKRLTFSLLAIIAFILASSSILIISNQGRKQDQLSQIKSGDNAISGSNPTPIIFQTAEWKSYKNEKYGFEVMYHPDSSPKEVVGNEDVGQFTYLLQIGFGTVPLKSKYGYTLEINKQKTLENYRLELIGHITDTIDAEEKVVIDGNTWTKLHYQMFLTTDYVPITLAFTDNGEYGFAITAVDSDIDHILSTFKFLDKTSTPTISPQTPGEKDGCIISGCSSEICAEEEMFSTCILKPENACYKTAVCEKQNNGKCGWTQTEELNSCLSQYK